MANSNLVATISTVKKGSGVKDFNKDLGALKVSLTDLWSGLQMASGAFQTVAAVVQSVINPVVDYAKEVRDLGRTIGATAEESSKLIQAADDVGISAGTIQSAMEAAIKKGVSPTIEGISALADEYLSIQDPIKRTKFLMDNFGKSGADLGPLMEQGAAGIRAAGEAAEASGLVMSEQAVQAARDYEIAMDDLGDASLALNISLNQELLPGVIAVTNAMTTQLQLTRVWEEAQKAGIVTAEDWQVTHHAIAAGFTSESEVLADLTTKLNDYKTKVEETDPSVVNMRLAIAAAAQAEAEAAAQAEAAAAATASYKDASLQLSDGLAGLTEKMIFNKAAMGLSDEAALALGISMGIVDTRVLALDAAIPALKEKYGMLSDGTFESKAAADAYAAAVKALSDALLAVPAHVESTVTTNFVNNGLPPGAYTGAPAGPPQGPIPQADGGDWLVTQPTLFLAGEAGPERATFTPLGGNGGGPSGGDTFYVTINAGGASAQGVADMLNKDDIRRRTGARRS